jgi:phosphatidylglycerol lysyltransferase
MESQPPPSPTHATIVELLRRYAWNSTAHQILNPGISHLLSAKGDAVTGYVDYGRVRVAAGVPVCAPERLREAMAEFEADAKRARKRVCYFYAEERVRLLVEEMTEYSVVQIGAQPVWDPQRWSATFDAHYSLRAQRQRARNKGIEVVEWDHARATRHPLLERCLAEWLATRRMAELHFLVEPDTLGRLEDRRLFAAQNGERVVGFLLASPVPLRRGWLIEQVIRGQHAPNGTAESLIDAAVRAMAAGGDTFVTLGLAPLAEQEARVENPWWLRILFAWARAHGRRFYNFGGLERFKAKFRPHQWEPIYLISHEPDFSFGTLLAVSGAFTGGRLCASFLGTLRRAVRQEFRWLRPIPSGKRD